MALATIWQKQREQLEDKHVRQVIGISGQGKLLDGSDAQSEFREFLSLVPSDLLRRYAEECLAKSFDESGFALQDIVNQVGHRLGFDVEDGRYRGTQGQIGHDGLWRFTSGHAIIVEVKTTDAYRIDLNTVAEYRRALVGQDKISKDHSSILIIVGREDTGDLEAQIRGSRHAWDIRLISVDGLLGLMALKEEVEDPQIIRRISDILIPREFTKLDEIIEIVFSAAEDVKQEEPDEEDEDDGRTKISKTQPSNFLDACVRRIEQYKKCSLIKRTRATLMTPDASLALVCAVSKVYVKGDQNFYWFGFHRHQREFLEQHTNAYVAFGCGSEQKLVFIPSGEFMKWVDGMGTSEKGNDLYWHVFIHQENQKLIMHRKKGTERIDLTRYLLPN